MSEAGEYLCRRLDYRFRDPDLLARALTHRSAGSRNNERLEFLGDAILGFVIANELYRRFQQCNEGELSRLRARLVKGETLASLAAGLDVGECLRLGVGEARGGGHQRRSILSDALEAIFGAVYLDGGFEAARGVILRVFEQSLNQLSPDATEKDPKTRLQEFLQSRGYALPSYAVVQESGPEHAKVFVVECCVQGLSDPQRGRGESRRKAEQDAAHQALQELQS